MVMVRVVCKDICLSDVMVRVPGSELGSWLVLGFRVM